MSAEPNEAVGLAAEEVLRIGVSQHRAQGVREGRTGRTRGGADDRRLGEGSEHWLADIWSAWRPGVNAVLTVVVAVVLLRAIMVGAAYFSPATASATTLGALLIAGKEHRVAPQFADELATLPALIGGLLWTTVLVPAAARSRTSRVA